MIDDAFELCSELSGCLVAGMHGWGVLPNTIVTAALPCRVLLRDSNCHPPIMWLCLHDLLRPKHL